jgi:hypothetical protein
MCHHRWRALYKLELCNLFLNIFCACPFQSRAAGGHSVEWWKDYMRAMESLIMALIITCAYSDAWTCRRVRYLFNISEVPDSKPILSRRNIAFVQSDKPSTIVGLCCTRSLISFWLRCQNALRCAIYQLPPAWILWSTGWKGCRCRPTNPQYCSVLVRLDGSS